MPRLTGQQIKTIAIVAMLLDHIAWVFLDLHSFWGQLLHIIGRITAPTMCFFIVEGYHHTRSVPKYLTRLFLFALISHFPFVYFLYGKFTFFPFSVLYTLALGLSAVYLWDRLQNNPWRLPLIIAIAVLSLPGDWMCLALAFVSFPYLPPQLQPAGGGHFLYRFGICPFPVFRQFNNRSKLAVSAARQRLSTGSNSQYSPVSLV